MKKFAMGALALASVAGAATAEQTGTLSLVRTFDLNTATVAGRATPGAVYSNVDNFTGNAYANGGAANQAGNTITTLVADDILMAGPSSITSFTFSVANFNTVAVSARARVRFYAADGAGGTPGTVITGFSFNPISFAASSVNTFTGNVAAFVLPAAFWAGITFDNNTGGTGATAAQLNNLGQGIFDPPVVGSSGNIAFQTTGAGSFLANNPAGSTFNFTGLGAPIANFGWEFIPTPGAAALFGIAGVAAARRRR